MLAAELFKVSGQVAVITGAGSGIGRAMADVMAANGARTVLCDIDGEAAARAADEISRNGGLAEHVALDIADRHAVHAAFADVEARHGRLDICFANAGISGGVGPASPQGRLNSFDIELWNRVLKVNLDGALYTLQAATGQMMKHGYGRVVVTASGTGMRGHPQVGYPYVTAKAGLINLVRQAAIEFAPHNILINAIAPGAIRTNIAGARARDPARDKAIAGSTLLGRLGEASEMMGVALLLASPAASFMTGSIVVADGGETAR